MKLRLECGSTNNDKIQLRRIATDNKKDHISYR